MKDILSFETAVRLKEAGFPQPAPEAGQFWYNPNIGVFLVGKLWMVDGRLRNIFYPDTGKVVNKEIRLFVNFVFAPTATDILREMPGCILAVENLYKEMAIVGVYYEVWKTGRLLSDHVNPAEAAAEAWLKLNEKK